MVSITSANPLALDDEARRAERRASSRRKKRIINLKGWAFLAPTFVFVGIFCYWPAVRFYGRSPLWAPLLPLIAGFYMA